MVSNLNSVDQDEWDALIIKGAYIWSSSNNVFSGPSYTRVADHLYIFRVLPEVRPQTGALDRVTGLNETEEAVTLPLRWGIPGQEISLKPGLDRDLSSALIKVADTRTSQSGLETPAELPSGVELDPFASGPRGIVLAGKLNAPKRGEVWFVPIEVETLGPWIKAAFASWRRQDPKKFPGEPDWWASSDWYTTREAAVAQQISEKKEAFEKVKADHEVAIAALESELEDAQEEASISSRLLLRGQDDPLQNAVGAALGELGFQVRDMDLEWEPKERREDFRITDPDDADWMVLGDATGVTGNAKGGKMAVLQSYVTKYVHEEKPEKIPGMWYLLNREIERDPMQRSTILRTDEIQPFAALQGLILDTTALFVLLRHAQTWPDAKPAIREYLRTSVGLIALTNAMEWIDKHQS